jgi:hypothetical protein
MRGTVTDFVFLRHMLVFVGQNEEYFYVFGLEFNLLFNFNRRILFSQRAEVKIFPL